MWCRLSAELCRVMLAETPHCAWSTVHSPLCVGQARARISGSTAASSAGFECWCESWQVSGRLLMRWHRGTLPHVRLRRRAQRPAARAACCIQACCIQAVRQSCLLHSSSACMPCRELAPASREVSSATPSRRDHRARGDVAKPRAGAPGAQLQGGGEPLGLPGPGSPGPHLG